MFSQNFQNFDRILIDLNIAFDKYVFIVSDLRELRCSVIILLK